MIGQLPGAAAYRGVGRARDKAFSLLVARSFAAFGRHSVIQPPARIVGERMIAIGAGAFIGANSWLQVIEDGDDSRVRLQVGDGTSIAGNCVLSAAQGVTIGRSVLLARNVYVSDHSHAFADGDRAILDQGIERLAAVEICDGAWLGQNTVVMPGVRIGAGAVVGANSVVTTDVLDRTVVAGAPARVLRELG